MYLTGGFFLLCVCAFIFIWLESGVLFCFCLFVYFPFWVLSYFVFSVLRVLMFLFLFFEKELTIEWVGWERGYGRAWMRERI